MELLLWAGKFQEMTEAEIWEKKLKKENGEKKGKK